MEGYKTVIAMLLGLAFSVMAAKGWIVPESDQAAIQGGIVSLTGLVLRFVTKAPVFKSAN